MLNFKTAILLGMLLVLGSSELCAATAATAPAAAPAKPELLVEGGLLGAISSSIDDVQCKRASDLAPSRGKYGTAHLCFNWPVLAVSLAPYEQPSLVSYSADSAVASQSGAGGRLETFGKPTDDGQSLRSWR